MIFTPFSSEIIKHPDIDASYIRIPIELKKATGRTSHQNREEAYLSRMSVHHSSRLEIVLMQYFTSVCIYSSDLFEMTLYSWT